MLLPAGIAIFNIPASWANNTSVASMDGLLREVAREGILDSTSYRIINPSFAQLYNCRLSDENVVQNILL